MGLLTCFCILLVLAGVLTREVDVIREETDYHIGRGLSNFASDSLGGCKDDRCRSSQHSSDRNLDYPSHHIRDPQDRDRDEAYVHEERNVDAFVDDREPHFHPHRHESLFRSDDSSRKREDSSYRTERDPTGGTYYAEPPRHVYNDQYSRPNRSEDNTRSSPFHEAHIHEERDYRLRDPPRSSSRSHSDPYSSRNGRTISEEDEQRSRLGLKPKSSRYDTRENERFVDRYFSKSRCPQLRELSRQTERFQARRPFGSQHLDSVSADDLYSSFSRRDLSLEDPSRVVVIRIDPSSDNQRMKKHFKRRSSGLQRRSEELRLDGEDFLQLLDMMDEEEELLTRPSSRLPSTSSLSRKLQLEMQDDEELSTLVRSIRSRPEDRCRSSASRSDCNQLKTTKFCDDEEEELSCSKLLKSNSKCTDCQAGKEDETESKSGKKTSSKGVSKNKSKNSNSNKSSKGGNSKKLKK